MYVCAGYLKVIIIFRYTLIEERTDGKRENIGSVS